MKHLSELDLERYHLGMVKDQVELVILEEHLLSCPRCSEAAEEAANYVNTLRQALILGGLGLEPVGQGNLRNGRDH